MASHLTHQLFAEDVMQIADPLHPFLGAHHRFLVLGAQGPDMFFHNQRTMPYGIQYGIWLHRRNFGQFIGELVSFGRGRSIPFNSAFGAFVFGYATHALLDRVTHPFINFFAGWVDPGDPSTSRFKSMHPFLERIIDVIVLRRRRNVSPSEFDFYSQINCGHTIPPELLDAYVHALAACYRKPAKDPDVRTRIQNAYSDAMGYYRYSNHVTVPGLVEGLRRERDGQFGPRWLSVLHPLWIDDQIDFLNDSHSRWCDPCFDQPVYDASFRDLLESGTPKALDLFRALESAWRGDIPPTARRDATPSESPATTLEAIIGNSNLSNERPDESGCTRRFSRPRPLLEYLEQLKARIGSYMSS